MPNPKLPPLRVKVIPVPVRGVWVLRWRDHDDEWHQCDAGVAIGGPAARDRQKSRSRAERAAADHEAKLRAEYARAQEAARVAALERARESYSWETQIESFVARVRSGRATSEEYVEQLEGRLRRFRAEARVEELVEHAVVERPLASPREITEDVIVRFLNRLTRTMPVRKDRPRTTRRKYVSKRPPKPPPPPPIPRPASAETKGQYLTAIKSFCVHLAKRKVLDGEPAADLRRTSAEVDRRRERRALTPDDFRRLIEAAQAGPTVEGMSGPDRAMMYLVATWTGYRRKELASVTLRHFQLDEETPVLRVKAEDSKRRRGDRVPLHAQVVRAFRSWAGNRGILSLDEPVFALRTQGGNLRKTSKMMRRDLAAAGLPYVDEEGLVADFHSNRAAFITNLIQSGIPFFRVVELARHSDPRLTKRYDKSTVEELSADVHRLPNPPVPGGNTQPPPPTIRFGAG